jgi:hypothetical protein
MEEVPILFRARGVADDDFDIAGLGEDGEFILRHVIGGAMV